MHPTAMKNGQAFFESYAGAFPPDAEVTVLDIGAQNVNGSLKDVCPPRFRYIGVDFVHGRGVDVVLDDPYAFPFPTASADIVVSSSCFEHSEMFWLVFLEIMRVLKPRGLFYLNAPSNGMFHRYPVDCWRFYPDSAKALANWAKRHNMPVAVLESYVSRQADQASIPEQWNDFVAVFVRDESMASSFPNRILDRKRDFLNGFKFGHSGILQESPLSEDQAKMVLLSQVIHNLIRVA